MIACGNKAQRRFASKIISVFIALSFLFTSIAPSYAQGLSAGLSAPSTLLAPTASFYPVLLRAIEIDPGNPFHFGFIVDSGDTAMEGEALTEEAKKLIRYFLASLTTPEQDMWVNLSPYEKDRIIPEGFGQTQMGRDLLSQDYILKQLTASLIYPEDELGKKFWEKVYKAAYEKYGTTDIPIDTFNKIWILPKKASIYEHNNRVFVVDSELAVMMEEDYLALQESQNSKVKNQNETPQPNKLNEPNNALASSVIREIVIPAIEKEVNFGKHFASLRQVYHAMILAAWYKNNLKESLLGKIYMDQNKIKGIDLVDSSEKQKIYEDYLNTFQKGIYDFIKVERDQHTGKNIPRKYFSGGFTPTTPDGTPLRQALEEVTPSADKLQTKGNATRFDANLTENKDGKGSAGSAIISRVSSLEPASVLLREIASKLESTGKMLLSFNILTEEGYSYGFSLSDPQASGRLSVVLPKAKKVTMFFKDRTSLAFAKDTANSRWKITQFYGQGFNFKDEGAKWSELAGSINAPKFRAHVDLKEMVTGIVAENMALRLTSEDIKQVEWYRPSSKSLMAEKLASVPQDVREPLTVKMFIRDGYVVLHRAKKANFWEFVSQGMPLAEDKEESVSSSIRIISKEEIDPFVQKLGMDKPGSTFNRDYFASLIAQYNQQMVDKQKGIVNDLVIGKNFFPNSMISASKMKEIMNATDFATEILSQEKKYLEAAKNVDHRIDFMNGGAGTSVGGVGAKSMALTFVEDLQGFDKDGNPKTFKNVEFSILDVKYVNNIIAAQKGRVAHVSIRELVSKDTVGPISEFRNDHICLLDKIDDRIPDGKKRTYAEYVREMQGISLNEDMVVQAIQPVVDVETGELTDRKTSPGGHGVFGRMAFEEILNDVLPEDKVVIRDITNGDGPNNQIPSVVLGWMAAHKVPMVLLSSTTMELDKKGGKVGAQPIEDGLLLQDLTADNTRINMMETVQAGKVGQSDLFQKIGLTTGLVEDVGQEGEQFFNTNIMGINETVLQPFLRELEQIIGHEQYVQWTSPTFIDNPKENGTIYQIEGALGHVLQNLDYHVRYTDNQQVKGLMRKYGWTRLLHIVNFTPEHRELCFTPVKFALDWNYYLSEHFTMDTKEWSMRNNKPGHLARFEFSKSYEDYYQKNKINAHKILPLGSKTLDLNLLYVTGKWTLNKPEYIGTVELRNDTDQEINFDELLKNEKYQYLFDRGILKRGSEGHLILDNIIVSYAGVDIDGKGTDLLVAPSQPVSSALISIPATTGREAAAALIKDHRVDPYFISGTDQSGNIKPFITAVWHAEAPKLSESEKKYYGLDFRDYFYGWSETELPISIHAFNQSERLLLRLSEDRKTYRSSGKGSKSQSMSSSLVAVERPSGTMNAYDIVMALKENIHHKVWSVEWKDSSYLEHEPGFAEFFKEKDLGAGQRLTVKFWQENRDSPLTQIMIDQYDLFASITALRFSWNDEKQNFDAVLDENIARKAQEIIKRMPASVASSGAIARQQLISPITRIMQDERSDVGTMGVKLRSGGYQRVSVSNPKAPWQDLDLREPIASIRIELGNGSSYYLNVRYEGKRAIIDVNKVRTTFSQTETVAARIAAILTDKRNFRLGSSRDRESYLRVLSESKERNWQAVDQISNNFSKERAVQKIKDLSAREKAVFVDIEQHSILGKDKIEQWLSKPGKPLAYQIRFQDGSYIYLVSKDLSYRDPVVSVTAKTAEVKSVVSAKRGYWTSDSAKIQRDVEEIISIIGREEKMETIKIFNPAVLYDANKLKLKDAIDRFKEKFSMLVTQKLEGIVLTFRTYSIEISVSKSTQQIIHVHVKDKQGMRLPGFDRSKLSPENVFSTASATTYIDGAPYGEPAQRTLGLEKYLEEKPNVPEVKETAPEKRGFLPLDSAKIQRDVEEFFSKIDPHGKFQTIDIRSFDENYRGYDASAGAQIKDAVDAFRERFGDAIKVISFSAEDFKITLGLEKFTRKVLEISVFDRSFREATSGFLYRAKLSPENFLSTAPEEKRAEVKSETSKPATEIPYDANIVSRKEKVSFKGVKFDVQEFSKRILDATKGTLLIDTGLDFDWRKNVIFSFSSQNKMDYRAMHKPAKNVSYMVVLRQVEDEMIEIEAEFQNSAGEMNHDEGLLRLAADILRSMSQEPGIVDAPQATEPAKLSELMPGEFGHQLLEFLDQLGVRELRAVNIFDGVSFYYFYSIKQIRESREEVAHALDGLVQEKSDRQSIEILWTANRVVIDLERGEVVGVRPGFATLGAGQEDIDRIRKNLPPEHFLSMAKSEINEEIVKSESSIGKRNIKDLKLTEISNYLSVFLEKLGEKVGLRSLDFKIGYYAVARQFDYAASRIRDPEAVNFTISSELNRGMGNISFSVEQGKVVGVNVQDRLLNEKVKAVLSELSEDNFLKTAASSTLGDESTSPFAFDGVPSTVIKSLPTASILDAVKAVEGVMGKKVESFLWNGLDYETEEDSHIFHEKLVETDSVMPNSLLFTFDTQEEKEMNVVILTDANKGVSIAVRKTDQGQGDKGFLVRNRGERQEDVEIKIKEKLEATSSSLTVDFPENSLHFVEFVDRFIKNYPIEDAVITGVISFRIGKTYDFSGESFRSYADRTLKIGEPFSFSFYLGESQGKKITVTLTQETEAKIAVDVEWEAIQPPGSELRVPVNEQERQYIQKLAVWVLKEMKEYMEEYFPKTSSRDQSLGGIDMSSSSLDLQIKRDSNGIPLPISQQPIEIMNIQGFTFEIMGITPVASLLLLSGLDTKTPSNKVKGTDTPELIGRPAEPALSVEEYAQVGLL